jgi:hypothetical protein
MTFQAGNRRFVEVKYDQEDVYTWREWEEIRKHSSDCRRPASLEAQAAQSALVTLAGVKHIPVEEDSTLGVGLDLIEIV